MMTSVTDRLVREWHRKRVAESDERAFRDLLRERENEAALWRVRQICRGNLKRSEMSFLTGTSGEVLYSSIATGTQLNTFTAEASLMGTLPDCIIPAGFFYNTQGATGKCLRIKAIGRLGTTGSPTFTWTIRFNTTSAFNNAAGISFSTAAITAGATVTLAPWYLDAELIFRTLGAPAGSTLAVMGEVRSPLGLATPFSGTIPTSNTGFTTAAFDNTVTNYLFLSAACGASNSLNLIQLEMMKVYGEN